MASKKKSSAKKAAPAKHPHVGRRIRKLAGAAKGYEQGTVTAVAGDEATIAWDNGKTGHVPVGEYDLL